MKYNSLIIGCGKIAGIFDNEKDNFIYSHAKAYKKNKNINKIFFCDIQYDKAKKLGAKYNSDIYDTNYINILNDFHPDLISVCTPSDTHFEICKKILSNNIKPKAILIEKPICESKNQFDELVRLSKKNKVKLFVNHSRRFDIKHNTIRKLVSKNFFGKIIRIDCLYYGGWENNGIHLVDTLNFIFDDELSLHKLISYKKINSTKYHDIDLLLKFKKNKSLVYANSFSEKNFQIFEFDFKFDESRLRIEDFGSRINYEKKVINNLNENILKPDLINFNLGLSPIENALNEIINSLQNKQSLYNFNLKDVYKSMNCVWEIKKQIC